MLGTTNDSGYIRSLQFVDLAEDPHFVEKITLVTSHTTLTGYVRLPFEITTFDGLSIVYSNSVNWRSRRPAPIRKRKARIAIRNAHSFAAQSVPPPRSVSTLVPPLGLAAWPNWEAAMMTHVITRTRQGHSIFGMSAAPVSVQLARTLYMSAASMTPAAAHPRAVTPKFAESASQFSAQPASRLNVSASSMTPNGIFQPISSLTVPYQPRRSVHVQLPLGKQISVKLSLESTIREIHLEVERQCYDLITGDHGVQLNGARCSCRRGCRTCVDIRCGL